MESNDQTAQLAALLAQMQSAGSPSAWAKPSPMAASAPAEVLGVSLPISLDTPSGKLRCYLNFPGSAAASPDALMALVQSLMNAGVPLDVWQPKQQGWGNRSGGGYNSNRGGWGR